MKTKTFKIYTLGCKVNQYDSGKLAAELESAGLVMARKRADLAVINSCAVTKTAMIKSGRMIKIARKENPGAKVILAGCWPRVYKINNAAVDLVLRDSNAKNLVRQIFNQYRKRPEIASPLANSGLAMTDRARYFIKIQDGCEQFCSYCIIPYTRGKLKSRGEREVLNEIKLAVKAGYQEIVLSGIHLGLYGKDKKLSLRGAGNLATRQSLINFQVREIASIPSVARNDNLVGLLKKIIKIKNLGRIRLSSIEITEVTEELINLMMGSKKICKHLHLPLQSGSDKILKLMNRPYDAEYFKNKIREIRRAMPDIAVTTDVIVGFPGETEKDFRAAEKLIKQIKFSRLHIFPFSAHAKTPAAAMPNQVDEKIKIHRAKILRELGAKLAEDYKNKFKGGELDVAIEQIKHNIIIGKTEYYFDIVFGAKQIIGKNSDISKRLIGKIVKVKNN